MKRFTTKALARRRQRCGGRGIGGDGGVGRKEVLIHGRVHFPGLVSVGFVMIGMTFLFILFVRII